MVKTLASLVLIFAMIASTAQAQVTGALAPYLQDVSVTIKSGRSQGSGVLITRVTQDLKKKGESYALEELIEIVRSDNESEKVVKSVIINEFKKAQGWEIFSKAHGSLTQQPVSSFGYSPFNSNIWEVDYSKTVFIGGRRPENYGIYLGDRVFEKNYKKFSRAKIETVIPRPSFG